MQHQEILRLGRNGDELKVLDRVELEIEHRRIGRVARRDKHERVAVRRGAHEHFGGDGGVGARPILDDVGDAALFSQLLREQSGNDVVRASRRKPDQETHGARWKSRRQLRKGLHRSTQQQHCNGDLLQ
jgi:hypothetical protein